MSAFEYKKDLLLEILPYAQKMTAYLKLNAEQEKRLIRRLRSQKPDISLPVLHAKQFCHRRNKNRLLPAFWHHTGNTKRL